MPWDGPELTIRLPDGAGLLAPYNYTIEATVMNPEYDLNVSNTWEIQTRVKNPLVDRVVDANRSFEGFFLRDLQNIEDDDGAAVLTSAMFAVLVSLWSAA